MYYCITFNQITLKKKNKSWHKVRLNLNVKVKTFGTLEVSSWIHDFSWKNKIKQNLTHRSKILCMSLKIFSILVFPLGVIWMNGCSVALSWPSRTNTQHISGKEAKAIPTQTFYHYRYSKQLILIFPLYLDNYPV